MQCDFVQDKDFHTGPGLKTPAQADLGGLICAPASNFRSWQISSLLKLEAPQSKSKAERRTEALLRQLRV